LLAAREYLHRKASVHGIDESAWFKEIGFVTQSDSISIGGSLKFVQNRKGRQMIASVKVQNFKNLKDQKIPLERFTVFVGANGSGKTSVLQAIDHGFRAVAEDKPRRAFVEDRHPDIFFARRGTGEIQITCETEPVPFSVVFSLPCTANAQLASLNDRPWNVGVHSVVSPTVFRSTKVEYHRLDATRIAQPHYSDKVPQSVGPDGLGLPSVLAFMALNDPDRFEDLTKYLRSLSPQFRRVRFHRETIKRLEIEYVKFEEQVVERHVNRTYSGDSLLFDFKNGDGIKANAVSEGTLLMVGILTILLGQSRPSILLLDDLDRGLHPMAQESLLSVLKAILDKFPDLQIITTTHSPYLLDRVEPEQVRLMALDDEGYAVCGKLSDHPEFEKWKREFSPGEFWSMVGEKWLTKREVVQ